MKWSHASFLAGIILGLAVAGYSREKTELTIINATGTDIAELTVQLPTGA